MMEKEFKVKCKECGEVFKMRVDTQEVEEKILMGFCPNCQKMVEVISKDFTQYSSWQKKNNLI